MGKRTAAPQTPKGIKTSASTAEKAKAVHYVKSVGKALRPAAGTGTSWKLNPINVGKFMAYCKRAGFPGITDDCIARGMASQNIITRRRALLAQTQQLHKFDRIAAGKLS